MPGKGQKGVLIWDFDGTLGRRSGGWAGAMVEVLKRTVPEMNVKPEQIRPYLQSGFPWHAPECAHENLSADDWWQDLMPVFMRAFRSIGVEQHHARMLAEKVRAAYTRLPAWSLFDDALPALERLDHAGWKHLILTNHVPELPALLAHLKLTPYFQAVFNSATTGFEKPNPHAFRLALQWIDQTLKVAPAKTCMIGDSLSADYRGAQEAGIKAVLVRTEEKGIAPCKTLSALDSFLT